MAAPLTPANAGDPRHFEGQRSRWIGGPRPPAAAVGATSLRQQARTRDDLEINDPLHGSSDSSFTIIMLAEHFGGGESGTQPQPADRASRRWALNPETEERWLQLLQAGRPPSLHPPSPVSASSSPTSTRWQFYGPRQPRRTPRASPSTPYTPYTTLYSPDTPELETPHDEVPGLYCSTQKYAESDTDSDSLHGSEFLITPFPLWEHPLTHSHPSQGPAATAINVADTASEPQYRPEVTPSSRPLQADNDTETRASVWGSGTPTSSNSEPNLTKNSRRSSRPRLSIITSSSWPRSSASSRDCPLPSEPVPLPSVVPRSAPSVLSQLTELLAADILQDKYKYKAFLAYRGDEAQNVLDCLQVVLDSPSLRNPDRSIILRALTRLSTNSGLYPHCFKLQGIDMLGSEPIDAGRYGDVWKGICHDQAVCVKILRSYQRMPTQPLFKNLSREALLWGQLSHPNILPFYGIHINELRRSRWFGLVSPWMENGNILNYLKQNPHVPRIPLIYDIANGLLYLHGLNVVHGDIKGTNILVTSTGRACLADFGLSIALGDNILVWPSLGSEPGRSGGTTRWRAPELFLQESMEEDSTPTPASDVYSFACAAYEVLTEQIPFYEIKQESAMILAKMSDSCPSPSRPQPEEAGEELTDDLWCLLEECWCYNPEERPSLDEVLWRLKTMMTPEQIQVTINGNSCVGACSQLRGDAVVSSSRFRKSLNDDDKPSEDDLLKVISMVRSL